MAANNTVSPDASTITAVQIVYPAVSGAGNTSIVYDIITVTAVSHAYSVWLRGNVGGEQLYLIAQDTTRHGSPRLTLTTAWQRFSFITPVLVAGSVYFSIGTDLNDSNEAATPAQTIYAWGAQVESIGYVTSYIPTTTAAVTRAADALSYPIASVTGFNATQGSLELEYNSGGSGHWLWRPVGDGGSEPRHRFNIRGSTGGLWIVNRAEHGGALHHHERCSGQRRFFSCHFNWSECHASRRFGVGQ